MIDKVVNFLSAALVFSMLVNAGLTAVIYHVVLDMRRRG